jgi:hypothetical protein
MKQEIMTTIATTMTTMTTCPATTNVAKTVRTLPASQIDKAAFYATPNSGFEGKPANASLHNPWQDNFRDIFCRPETKIDDDFHANHICDKAIGTQYPINSYLFWQKVVKHNVSVIVNVHNESTYHSPEDSELVENWNDRIFVYKVSLNNYGSNRVVHLIHAKTWGDYSVPTEEDCLMTFKLFFKYYTEGRFMIHCRAGIGRTGIFLAIYYAVHGTNEQLQTILKGYEHLGYKTWDGMRLEEIMNAMRLRRLHLIQTYEQFCFCETFINKYRNELLSYDPEPIQDVPIVQEQIKTVSVETTVEPVATEAIEMEIIVRPEMRSLKPFRMVIKFKPALQKYFDPRPRPSKYSGKKLERSQAKKKFLKKHH